MAMIETPQTENPQKKSSEGSVGPIIGTLIIVILLIVSALYIWGQHLNTAAQIEEQSKRVGTTTIIIYSTSTEPLDIQRDLESNPPIQSPGF